MRKEFNSYDLNLIRAITTILKANVTTAATLLATDPLKKQLMESLYLWAANVGCIQTSVLQTGRQIRLCKDELVSDFVCNLFNPGKDVNKPYPRLTSLLSVAHEKGAEVIPAYLMTSAHNRAMDLARRYSTHQQHTGRIMGYDANDEYEEVDPGKHRDNKAVTWGTDLIQQKLMDEFLSHIGENFISDLVIIAGSEMDVSNDMIAKFFFAEKLPALVSEVTCRLSFRLGRDVRPCMKTLMDAAKSYVLPARYKANYKALCNMLYRQSNGAARRRLLARARDLGLDY